MNNVDDVPLWFKAMFYTGAAALIGFALWLKFMGPCSLPVAQMPGWCL